MRWVSLLVVLLAGCTANSITVSELASRSIISQEMNTTEIVLISKAPRYVYVVRDEFGAVWIVDCTNSFNNEITGSVQIFGEIQKSKAEIELP